MSFSSAETSRLRAFNQAITRRGWEFFASYRCIRDSVIVERVREIQFIHQARKEALPSAADYCCNMLFQPRVFITS